MTTLSKTMRLPASLCARIEAHQQAEGLTSFAAAVADLVGKGLDMGTPLATLPTAPTPPRPKPKAAPPRVMPSVLVAETQTPPPMDRARVSQIEGIQHGRPRPAYGSLMKGPKGKR